MKTHHPTAKYQKSLNFRNNDYVLSVLNERLYGYEKHKNPYWMLLVLRSRSKTKQCEQLGEYKNKTPRSAANYKYACSIGFNLYKFIQYIATF